VADIDSDPQRRLRLRLPAANLIPSRAAAIAAALAISCTAAPPPAPLASSPDQASQSHAAEATAEPCPEPCRGPPVALGRFPVRAAPEASGLVTGRRNPDAFYVLDDGPGTTSLLVIRTADAKVRGRLEIAGLDSTDSEALAAGPCTPDPGDCLYVGDIGDNVAARDSIVVWRVREPASVSGTRTLAAERAVLRYPDGPHDAEALMVDDDGTIGILTKAAGRRGRGAARLYLADRFADGELRDAERVRVPQPSLPLAAAVVGHVVTGGDWRPGGVVLRTYDAVFEYRDPAGTGGLEKFASWPVTEISPPPEQQGEAVAYGSDGCSLYTVSEASGAVFALRCN
jgi:hypothetical protein